MSKCKIPQHGLETPQDSSLVIINKIAYGADTHISLN